ncbi:hypothetical protein ACHQM5_003729 [Ranunculus cassubicifolius]
MVSKKAAFVLLLVCLMFFAMGQNLVAQPSSNCVYKGGCRTRLDCRSICNSTAICAPYNGKATCCCLSLA